MKKLVPGWHGSSYQKVSKMFLLSKGAGKNGIRRIYPSNRSEKIGAKMEEKDNGNDEKRFGPF
jgi:hypothetical protein